MDIFLPQSCDKFCVFTFVFLVECDDKLNKSKSNTHGSSRRRFFFEFENFGLTEAFNSPSHIPTATKTFESTSLLTTRYRKSHETKRKHIQNSARLLYVVDDVIGVGFLVELAVDGDLVDPDHRLSRPFDCNWKIFQFFNFDLKNDSSQCRKGGKFPSSHRYFRILICFQNRR